MTGGFVRRAGRRARGVLAAPPGPRVDDSQPAQRVLWQQLQQRAALGLPPPRFSEVGFRVYSQFDEDGILLLLFAELGTTDRRCVELAFGSPVGANTTNLLCNWGWRGLLIDGDAGLVEQARAFFAAHRETAAYPPTVVQAWVDAANVDDVLRSGGVEGEVDLLSLDLDGIDYWVWEAMTAIAPRVVVVECSGLWAPHRAVTVPNDPGFARPGPRDPLYAGASLLAFARLGRRKGYRLVGVHRLGFNAFFVRDDLVTDRLPEVSPAEIDAWPEMRWITAYREQHFPNGVPGRWIEV